MVTGDDGRRLVQNLRDVARNGLAARLRRARAALAAAALADAPAVSVTILGAGGVGKHAIEWAARCGDDARNERFMREGLPGVEVVVAEQNLAGNEAYFRHRLALTDILVDATARRDTSRPLFPNAWLGFLPGPRGRSATSRSTRTCSTTSRRSSAGSRASPRATSTSGSSRPDDPAWDRLPPGIPTASVGRSSRATRGRASGRRRAWRPTAPR